MLDPLKTKYVCIHGHFYQPPRENPWLDEQEMEVSAAPHHDWNERISKECYRANSAARLVDEQNRVIGLRSNYQYLSFNFGPTLMRWMERHAPWVHQAIVGADGDSCRRLDGHGNAIAQAHGHIIMPLANARDKKTQVLWGIKDFEYRFGRMPEGMWLPETAVDRATLEVLADAGITFTILSPFQASRWRLDDQQTAWHDAVGGTIPTGRPYRCRLGTGKTIVIYFYDARLAQGIAFERLLDHSGRLIAGIDASYQGRSRDAGPWLVHTATDGESYGHHFHFGDMALAAAFRSLEQSPVVQLTNYGWFLASFGAHAEVEIVENTAWSCAHGVGRWQENCGCRTGGESQWNQQWRAPLRNALNRLRDRLAQHYEREMEKLVHDPWEVRDHYIEVVLDPHRKKEEIIQQYARSDLTSAQRCRFFQLLETQRSAMAMFTSCGWFFDDISGLESMIILRHAARAIQLASFTGVDGMEAELLEHLAEAPCNAVQYANGADLYRQVIKPEVVTHERVAANYAMQALLQSSPPRDRLYSFSVRPRREDHLGSNPLPCLIGELAARDDRTLDERKCLYAVIHFGALDFRCFVKLAGAAENYDSILGALQQAVAGQDTVQMMRILEETFNEMSFTLRDCFRDVRHDLALQVSRQRLKIYSEFQRHVYQENRSLMFSLRDFGVSIPLDLRGAVRQVLSAEVSQLVEEILKHERHQAPSSQVWQETDFFARSRLGRLRTVLGEARDWQVALDLTLPTERLGLELVATFKAFIKHCNAQRAGKILRLLQICKDLEITPNTWTLQTLYHQLLGKIISDSDALREISQVSGFFKDLDEFLNCRFARAVPDPECVF